MFVNRQRSVDDATGRELHEICRALKYRRQHDGFSYRTNHDQPESATDPSTWELPVYHAPVWYTRQCVIHYVTAFPQYADVLTEHESDGSSAGMSRNA